MGAKRKPTKRITKPQGGRPARLIEPAVRDTLIDAIELGVPVSIACQGVSIAEQSYRNWLRRGLTEHENRASDGYEPNDAEQPYVEFYEAIQHARVKAATRNVHAIQKAAQGGSITEKATKRYRDHEGNDVVEEVVKRTAPDWRAAAWYLERSHRSEFGKDSTHHVELTGADGGPVQIEGDGTPADDLSRRLSEHLAAGFIALNAAQTHEADDDAETVDGEIVE